MNKFQSQFSCWHCGYKGSDGMSHIDPDTNEFTCEPQKRPPPLAPEERRRRSRVWRWWTPL